jgi:hypothetical protein
VVNGTRYCELCSNCDNRVRSVSVAVVNNHEHKPCRKTFTDYKSKVEWISLGRITRYRIQCGSRG